MVAIQWPTILANVGPEAALLLIFLAALMAVPAQGLELAQPKKIPIAFVRHDVVGDHSSDHEILLQAIRAQRMQPKLGTGACLPTA